MGPGHRPRTTEDTDEQMVYTHPHCREEQNTRASHVYLLQNKWYTSVVLAPCPNSHLHRTVCLSDCENNAVFDRAPSGRVGGAALYSPATICIELCPVVRNRLEVHLKPAMRAPDLHMRVLRTCIRVPV